MKQGMNSGRMILFRSTLLAGVMLVVGGSGSSIAVTPLFNMMQEGVCAVSPRSLCDVEESAGDYVEIVIYREGGSMPALWEQRFEKVHDAVELRNQRGDLIKWDDRGMGGRYTWSHLDPVLEVRDITQWVGSGNPIHLYARVLQLPRGTGDRHCDMDTLSNGARVQRWEFDDKVDYEIKR